MLHDLLRKYLEDVESAVRILEDAYVERYQEEILTPTRVTLRIRLRLSEGSLLELNEAVTVETDTIKYPGYRYHFQDRQNRLLFRYDNTPHFPEFDNFPHHKHVQDEVTPCEKPSIPQIIEEMRRYLAA